MSDAVQTAPGSKRRVPRTRGAASGVLLMLLGAWGAVIPFIGPYFDFAFTPSPNKAWYWTAARGWYEVLPGCVAFLGGFLLLLSTSRVMALLGAWLGIAAGAWFVIGPPIATELTLGSIGHPDGTNSGLRVVEALAFFYLLGAVILFLAAAAFGRLSVVSLRDVRVAERRQAAQVEAEEAAARDAAARDAVQRDADERRAAEQAAAERDAANRRAADQRATQEPTGAQGGTHAYPAGRDDGQYGDTTYGRHDRGTTSAPQFGTPGSEAQQQYPAGYNPPPPPTNR